jgi:hypothetical protein
VLDQLADAGRGEGDAVLVCLDLGGDADLHSVTPRLSSLGVMAPALARAVRARSRSCRAPSPATGR